MKVASVLVAVLTFFSSADGLRVLGFLPFGSTSHFAVGHAIVESLLEAGHEVTVVSPYPQKNSIKNYRDISAKDSVDKYQKGNYKIGSRS